MGLIQRVPGVDVHTVKPVKINHLYTCQMTENAYRIVALFGACVFSQKNVFWELFENAGVPIFE